MTYSARWLCMMGLVTACQKGSDDTGDTNPDETDVAAPDCTEDDECRAGSVCTEEGECVSGDRDNSFPEATPIYQDTPVDGLINPDGDIDYYAYTSVGKEWLRIETTPDEVVDGLDTVVSVFNAGGGLHAIEDDYPMGNVSNFDTVLYAYLPTAGVWYFTVEDRSSNEFYSDGGALRGGTEFAYALNIKKFSNVTDEPDGIADPSAEVKLETGTTSFAVGVLLEEVGDTDWISVSLPFLRGPLEVRGNALIPGTDADPRVETYRPDGTLVARKDGVGPDGVALYFDTTKEVWTVGATDVNGSGGPGSWYTLYVRTRDVDYYNNQFDTEPDDSAAPPLDTYVATTSSGEDYRVATISGALDPEDDVDRFTISVESDEYVTVYCSADVIGSLGDPKIDVFGPDDALLGSATGGEDLAPDVLNLKPDTAGFVTLQLSGEGTIWGPSAYYLCTAYLTRFEVAE